MPSESIGQRRETWRKHWIRWRRAQASAPAFRARRTTAISAAAASSSRISAALVHEHWGDNVFLETVVEADLEPIRKSAAITVKRRFRTARQCMSPIEGRGAVAVWDRRLEQLLIYTATQIPHIVRTGLAGCL